MSTLMRPYSVTLASCARADGAVSRPATTTATSFVLKNFLRLRMISQWKAARSDVRRSRQKNGRPKAPVCHAFPAGSRMRHSFDQKLWYMPITKPPGLPPADALYELMLKL